ncbi:GNAT family N-acetyltransferase [Frateuria aurantia]
MNASVRISTDSSELDIAMIHGFLCGESSWSRGISRPRLEQAVANSLCFGAYRDGRQVGFARVVTDRATFAYLCDVFVVAAERGRGHARALLEAVTNHPQLQGLRRFSLASSSARDLYASYGFAPPLHPSSLMEKFDPDAYQSTDTL